MSPRPHTGPKIPDLQDHDVVGFTLPPDLIEWIEEASAKAGLNKSAFVAQVLERSRRAARRRR